MSELKNSRARKCVDLICLPSLCNPLRLVCALARFTAGSKTEVSLQGGLQPSTYCIPVGYPHVIPGDRRRGGTGACGQIAGGGRVSVERPQRTFAGRG